jgi:integrase
MRWHEYKAVYLGYCSAHKRPRTIKNFDEPALRSFDFQGDLAEITPLTVTSWVTRLRSRYRTTTVAMFFGVLSTALNRAVKMGLLTKNPCDGLPRPSREAPGRVLSPAEEALMLRHAPEPLRSLAVFAMNTGMRLGEIQGLRWEDVQDSVAFINNERRKNKKGLQMPLNSAALAVMGKPARGKVFVFRSRTVQGQLLRISRELGLGRVRFHDFRHTFVTRYLRHGRPKDLVAMGTHANLNGLDRYDHPVEEQYKARIELMAKREAPPQIHPWWGSSTTSSYSYARQLRREGLEPSRLAAYAPQTYSVTEFDHLGLA